MTEILDLAKDGQYHLACAKYFEVMHNKPASKPLLHPNAYFAESRAVLMEDDSNSKGKKEKKNIFYKNLFHYFYYTCNILLADVDNKDQFSQSVTGTPGDISSRKSDRYSTPSRNSDFTGTPKRSDRYTTPSRNTDTVNTPLRKIQTTNYQTPSKKTKMTPVNIVEMLNDDDFTDFMDVDLTDHS